MGERDRSSLNPRKIRFLARGSGARPARDETAMPRCAVCQRYTDEVEHVFDGRRSIPICLACRTDD